MISRQGVLRAREGHRDDAGGSSWRDDDLVVPSNPGVGRYRDDMWVFPPDRASGRPSRIEFGDAGMFPNDDWRRLARDLGMVLVGRQPGREQLSRSRQKPVTVAQALRRVGLLGRWATAVGHGLPSEWTSTTVDAFVVAYHASRLPNRVASDNPKSTAGTRHTLAAYLNLIALLHEHRNQLCHGMGLPPWTTWPSVGAYEMAGVVEDLEGRTAIIEPDAWGRQCAPRCASSTNGRLISSPRGLRSTTPNGPDAARGARRLAPRWRRGRTGPIACFPSTAMAGPAGAPWPRGAASETSAAPAQRWRRSGSGWSLNGSSRHR